MKRTQYFNKINSIKSPILLLPEHLGEIVKLRTNDLIEPIEDYLSFADSLTKLAADTAKTRAEFIRMQCTNIDAYDFFEQHCESWGIPKFDEGLITADDFKNGFLWGLEIIQPLGVKTKLRGVGFSKTLKHNLYGTTSFGLATMDQTKLYHKKAAITKASCGPL